MQHVTVQLISFRLILFSNVIFNKPDNLSKIAIYKLSLEQFLAWTSLNLTIREDRILYKMTFYSLLNIIIYVNIYI